MGGAQLVVLVLVGQGDEGQEALVARGLGAVLQVPQAQQVVHPVAGLLDVAVEHGAVGGQALAVAEGGGVQVDLGVLLADADLLAQFLVEDLGAAAGAALQARGHAAVQEGLGAEARDAGVVVHLDHGEDLEVDGREARLDLGEQVLEVVDLQLRVVARGHVQLADPSVLGLLQLGDDLLGREGVGPGVAGLGLEGAELAVGEADIGVGQPAAHHVVGGPAVLLEPHMVGHGADAREVGALVEQQAVVVGQAFAAQHLVRQGQQARVADLRRE